MPGRNDDTHAMSHGVWVAIEEKSWSSLRANGLARMARWWYSLPTFVSSLCYTEACDIAPLLVLRLAKGLAMWMAKAFRSRIADELMLRYG